MNPHQSDVPRERKPRVKPPRKRKSLQSGYSLLSRGEPQIWFTGGMLVVCLAMIVGLLGLILASGLPSFWPRPVELLALNDGSLEIGQPQNTKVTKPEPDNAADVAQPDQQNVQDQDTVQDSSVQDGAAVGLSRYYRSGNFDVTNQHYRWLTPAELDESGIGRPSAAMAVERLEWGRFYGLPISLTETFDVDPQSREKLRLLEELREFMTLHDSGENNLLQRLQDALTLAANDVRSTALKVRVADFPREEAAELRVQSIENATPAVAGDQWRTPADAGSDRWAAARATWSAEPAFSLVLAGQLARLQSLRSTQESLKYEISRLDGRISENRSGIRRAELQTDTTVSVQVDGSHFLLEQQELFSERTALVARLDAALGEYIADAELRTLLSKRIANYRDQQLPIEIQTADQQLEQWLDPLRSLPKPVFEAIREYQSTYREILRTKEPLERELTNVQYQLGLVDVKFAIPSNATSVPGATPADMDELMASRLTPNLTARLSELGIEVNQIVSPVESVSPRLALLTVAGSDTKYMLAISTPGYVGTQTDSLPRKLMVLSEKVISCADIVRAIPVNRIGFFQKISVYCDRWHEFLWSNPREANTEGGVFPAIWGTIVMTLIMTIAVVPFGVMAALYLREYTKSGPLVSIIRISINNLAGVPSIVYGVFGFSFFCYTMGAYIDGGPENADITPWPSALWYSVLAAIAVVGTLAFFCSFLSSGPTHSHSWMKKWMGRAALLLWICSISAIAVLMLKSPFFHGFYPEYLPNPTYGKGGMLWAALTLALLTLPVVIVATEEALAAVPNSLREGSLACGASKWQTIRRIVLPHARPGIMTGAILAMARGAGEVAPLMLVGALPSAPDLPLDGEFPYLHGSRSFMHLGYQIYTLGFQSQNSEAAKPMVFTCTLLLILIVAALNISAIYLRARLRRRFVGNQF